MRIWTTLDPRDIYASRRCAVVSTVHCVRPHGAEDTLLWMYGENGRDQVPPENTEKLSVVGHV